MAWNDSSELVVAGTGEVSIAPVGTTLPTTLGALDAAFIGTGYITEDGVSFSSGSDITDFNAWQSRQAVRRERNTQEIIATFALTQWNEETVPFAFGGGDVTESGGVYRFDFPTAGDALDERSMVIDVQDGDRNMRFVIPRGTVVETVEASFTRTELAILPISFSGLEPTNGGAPAYFLTDDAAAFVAGS